MAIINETLGKQLDIEAADVTMVDTLTFAELRFANMMHEHERSTKHIRATLAGQLADVVICADLIAMAIGVDLGKAVREKFNESSDKLDKNAQNQSQTFEGS